MSSSRGGHGQASAFGPCWLQGEQRPHARGQHATRDLSCASDAQRELTGALCATPRPVTPGRLGRPDDEDVNLDGYGLCALVAVIVQYIFHTVQYSEYIQW